MSTSVNIYDIQDFLRIELFYTTELEDEPSSVSIAWQAPDKTEGEWVEPDVVYNHSTKTAYYDVPKDEPLEAGTWNFRLVLVMPDGRVLPGDVYSHKVLKKWAVIK
jgi:hypothetical protein